MASATILKQNGATPSTTGTAIPFYDASGHSITPSTNYPTTLYSYDADGNVTKVAFPNGTETDTDYTSYWATGTGGVFGTETITNKRSTTTLSSYQYSFDADRRKISDLETVVDVGESTSNTQKYTWTYDALSRLTAESFDYNNDNSPTSLTGHTTDDQTETYTYDADGNRLTKTLDIGSDAGISGHTAEQVVEYKYDADNEVEYEGTDNYDSTVGSPVTTSSALQFMTVYGTLSSSSNLNSTWTSGYDLNGSVLKTTDATGATTGTYTYDVLNRMSTAAVSGTTWTYHYTGDNNIFTQTPSSGTTNIFTWDTNNATGYAQVLEMWQGGSTPAQSYTIANSVIGQNVGGTVSFFFADDQNTTRQVTAYTPSTSTTNGHVTGRYDYDGFGVAVTFRNTSHATGATTWVGFQGEYVDQVTLMSIMGAREYVARTGRFWTMDGISLTAGDLANANLYLFVGNNPTNSSDPTGHDKGSDQAFALADEYRADEISGFGQLVERVNGATMNVFSQGTSTFAGLEFSQFSTAAQDTINSISNYLDAPAQSISQALVQGAWAGVLNFADNFTFHQYDSLHRYRNQAWQSAGMNGTAIGYVSNAFSWLAVGAFDLAAILSGEGCFLSGTPVLMGNGKEQAIDTIHVGDRVATDGGVANSPDGKTKAADPNATEVNRKTWRELTIVAGDWEVKTLEPLSWIKAHDVKDGSSEALTNFVDLVDMGVPAGLVGTVESITSCPTIQGGSGRVVLATVSHLNDFVYHLTLKNSAGQPETLGVSGYHRFYDEATGWTEVQNMHDGEIVRGDLGDLTVVGLVRDPGVDRVYNMTVEADHVYYVGDLTALVHNSCPVGPGDKQVVEEALKKALGKYDFEDPFDIEAMSNDEEIQLLLKALDAIKRAIAGN